jgi:type IV pilus assembly protein PilC
MTQILQSQDRLFGNLNRGTPAPAAKQETAPLSNGRSGYATRLKKSLAGQTITKKQLLIMTSQLSVMLAAGCDLVAGLDAMAKQQPHKYSKQLTEQLRDAVKNGRSFSQALAAHPDVFDPLYVTMVRAGESAGLLKQMLQALQIMIRNQVRVTTMIRSALMYPSILLSVAITAIIVMTTFVLPRFAKVFSASGVALPTPTKIVLGAASFAGDHAFAIIGGIVAAIIGVLYLLQSGLIKNQLDTVGLKVPLLGQALKLSYVCRSIQTLGMLTKSGLPLAESIMLTRDLMPNSHYWNFYNKLNNNIVEGKGLSADFEKTTLFPPMVSQMIAVGEQTGTIATVCGEIASFHEEELADRIKIVTTAIEPIIIVLLGGFVGFIAVAVILPMFKISSAVK